MLTKFESHLFFQLATIIIINQLTFGQEKFKLSTEKELLIFASGSTFLLSSILIEKKDPITYQELTILDRNKVNIFDRSAINYYSKDLSLLSDVLLVTSVSLPVAILLFNYNQTELEKISLMYLETMLLTYGVTNLTKNITGRYRPYAYNPSISMIDKSDPDVKKSFFSGHTSTAFTSALFFSTVYGEYNSNKKDQNFVIAGSLTLATTVGLLRFFSGKHFPTDIIAGAIVGSLIGYGIPKLHQTSSNLSISSNQNLITLKFYF